MDRRRAWDVLGMALVVVAVCLPVSLLRGDVFTMRDAAFSMVGIEHLERAILGEAAWTGSPLAWPLPDTVTQTDWMAGQAVLALPGRIVALPPWYSYSILVCAGLLVSALAMKWTSDVLFGPGPESWIAGIAGGLNASSILHAQHANLVFHGVAWLGILAAGVGLRDRRPALAGLGGALLASSFHFGVYIGLHGCFVAAVLGAVAAGRRVGGAREWAAFGLGFAALFATVLPVLWVYHRALAGQHAVIPLADLNGESIDPSRVLAPIREAWAHAPLRAVWPGGNDRPNLDPPNPGYTAAALAAGGAIAGWRTGRRPVVLVAIGLATLAFVLGLGPDVLWRDRPALPGPYRLLLLLPGFSGLRAPSRWLEVAWPALALLAALGVRALGARIGRPGLVAFVAALLLIAELPRLEAGPVRELAPPPAYRHLDGVDRPGPMADFVRGGGRGDGCTGQQRLMAALEHRRPVVGGQFARFSPALAELNKVSRHWPSPASVTLLEAIGAAIVFEHPPLSPSVPAGLACVPADDHRICVLPRRDRPLPRPEDVVEGGGTPVIGVRFAAAPAAASITLTCGDRADTQPTRAWVAVTALREIGGEPSFTDVFLDAPCDGPVGSDPPGGRPLSVRAGAAGSSWP